MRWQRVSYQPNTGIGVNGQKVTACAAHRTLSREAAKEGMILLKNKGNLLPFAEGTRVALFGKGAFDYVKGGGGSGDVTVEYVINLYEGLKSLGSCVRLDEDLASYYRKNVRDQYENGAIPGMTVEPAVPEELMKKSRAWTDTALITICRFSGEGWDRKSSYDKEVKTEEWVSKISEDLFPNGDFYLTDEEKAMVDAVTALFPKTAVVLNVGGVISAEWFAENDAVSSVLMAWQGGMEGGRAAAELLCGIGNPSGKLADTFAKRLEDYPSSYNFHESENYVEYTDDIYVGYRYFETIPGAKEKVIYPFGYGLSYTSFSVTEETCTADENTLTAVMSVCNTGSRAGKEVVQIYGSAPQGLLGKPSRVLMGFAKTKELAPGETQKLFFSCSMETLSSYDDLGKVRKASYVLEKGTYHFYAGTSVRDTEELPAVWEQKEDRIVRELTSRLVPSSLKKRMLSDGSFEELPQSTGHKPDEDHTREIREWANKGMCPAVRAVRSYSLWRENPDMPKYRLIDVAEGRVSMKDFIAQMSDADLSHLLGGQPNTGVANTFGWGNMPEYGIPNFMTADGPAGLRIQPECGVCTTAWPCATLLACTWNPEVVRRVGEAGAKEVKENNIAAWLTPAVNIHRTPMCGRNFEYYSEDPFLVGKMAGAMVRGIQSQHIAATVKHFALNNKETNRKDSDSRVSERAAREIYLKGFEMIVKEEKPWCIMSSYNIINGYRASENHDLLEGILREEWGFEGFVTTDWWTNGEHFRETKAGNDMKMPVGMPDDLLEAREKGLLSREEMERCAERILNVLIKID